MLSAQGGWVLIEVWEGDGLRCHVGGEVMNQVRHWQWLCGGDVRIVGIDVDGV